MLKKKKRVKQHKLNTVKLSMKSWSRSATVDGSGQGTSWQKCVCSFFSLEALEFEKQVKCTATLFILPPPMAMAESDPYVAPAY